jgi:hypothetical protein
VLALQHRVVHALSGVPTAPLPYHPETQWRPSDEDILTYVEDHDVADILSDGTDAESAAILTGFVRAHRSEWRLRTSAGRLSLYGFSKSTAGDASDTQLPAQP